MLRVPRDPDRDPTWGHIRYTAHMAQLKVRQLDDRIAGVLKTRANHRGVSLEEEVRLTLAASVGSQRMAFERRARASREATGRPGSPTLDSARSIRKERDANG